MQVILWQELEDVMRAIKVTAHQECLHPFLQILYRAALLNFLQVEFGCLSISELLEMALGKLDVEAAELGVDRLPRLDILGIRDLFSTI